MARALKCASSFSRESRWTRIKPTLPEQAVLETAGKQLAKGTDRFGRRVEGSTSSVVRVRRVDETYAEVRIADAIGMVATSTLQVQVELKIPQPHLLHLFRRANVLPRLAEQPGALEEESNFAILVSNWFVVALDRLLAEGIARDYRPVTDEISAVRGRIVPLATARFFYRGRTTLLAECEEFDCDTPLNEQLSNVVDEKVVKHQAATFSSVVVVSSSVTLIPSLNFMPASTSLTSSWPLNRRQRSWAASRSL